jgi:hypothetical protein
MSVDERRRLQLADAAKRALGDDAGITLMEMLPPVGWADVATKQDLLVVRGDIDLLRRDLGLLEERLEAHFDARFERGFRQILVTVTTLLIGGFLASTAATVAAALIR